MHLAFSSNPTRPTEFVAHPTVWKVVDDFGTDHQVDLNADLDFSRGDMFGGFDGRSARRAMLRTDWQDPDFFRAECTRPEYHRIDEAMSFATPLGLSIEVDLRIAFHVVPAWDEEKGIANFGRAAGARLEVLSHTGWAGCETVNTVTTAPAALEEFCWQYLDLERARDAAGAQS